MAKLAGFLLGNYADSARHRNWGQLERQPLNPRNEREFLIWSKKIFEYTPHHSEAIPNSTKSTTKMSVPKFLSSGLTKPLIYLSMIIVRVSENIEAYPFRAVQKMSDILQSMSLLLVKIMTSKMFSYDLLLAHKKICLQ